MLSQIPVDFNKLKKAELNNVILRAAIIGELDAINLYEQLAAVTYVWELEAMLLRLDREQVEELEQGKKEVQELTGK